MAHMLDFGYALVSVNYENTHPNLFKKKALYNGAQTAYNADCFTRSLPAKLLARMGKFAIGTCMMVFFQYTNCLTGEICL